jgi:phenylalanine-4-hydroxylase
MLETTPIAPSPALGTALPDFVPQQYERYDSEAHDVWRILYERRMETLRTTGSEVFLQGIERIGLAPDRVPDLADVNRRLAARTGWAAVGVRGFIPAAEFFRCLSQRRFPTTLIVRPRAQLDYLPEPDIFHDVFGHVPLHSHPVFADFLQQFGALAADARSDADVTAMARLFWFTVEFGLIREEGEVKIYGSGLISSHGDAANALGPTCARRPFDLDRVLAQPFEIDHFQDVLFVIESFEQLFEAVHLVRHRLDRGMSAQGGRAAGTGGA